MEQKWTIGNTVYIVNALVLVFAGLMAVVNVASAQDRPAVDIAVAQPQVASQSVDSDVDCDPFQKPYHAGSVKLEDQMRDLGLVIAENQGTR